MHFRYIQFEDLKNELLRTEKRSISIITGGDFAVAHDLGIRPILEHYEFLI